MLIGSRNKLVCADFFSEGLQRLGMLLEDCLRFLWCGFPSLLKHPALFVEMKMANAFAVSGHFYIAPEMLTILNPIHHSILKSPYPPRDFVDMLNDPREEDDVIGAIDPSPIIGFRCFPLPRKYLRLLVPDKHWDALPAVLQRMNIVISKPDNISNISMPESELQTIAANFLSILWQDIASIIGVEKDKWLAAAAVGNVASFNGNQNLHHVTNGSISPMNFVNLICNYSGPNSFNGHNLKYLGCWQSICDELIPDLKKQAESVCNEENSHVPYISKEIMKIQVAKQITKLNLHVLPYPGENTFWSHCVRDKKKIVCWNDFYPVPTTLLQTATTKQKIDLTVDTPLYDFTFYRALVHIVVDSSPKLKNFKAKGELKNHCLFHLVSNPEKDNKNKPKYSCAGLRAKILDSELFIRSKSDVKRKGFVPKSNEELYQMYLNYSK